MTRRKYIFAFACWKTLRIENNSNSRIHFSILISHQNWFSSMEIWVLNLSDWKKVFAEISFILQMQRKGRNFISILSKQLKMPELFFVLFENKVRPCWHEIAMKLFVKFHVRFAREILEIAYKVTHTCKMTLQMAFILNKDFSSFIKMRKRHKYFIHFYYSEVHWIPLRPYLVHYYFENASSANSNVSCQLFCTYSMRVNVFYFS